jgi:ribosomal protein L37E
MDMDESQTIIRCYRCGEIMQKGFATAGGLIGHSPDKPRLVFVVAGKETSPNPIKAFQQGMQGDPTNQAFLIQGYYCSACGIVELRAGEKIHWDP